MMTIFIVILPERWQSFAMPDPTEALIDEVRLLYQSLVQIGERLHADSNISLGMRAVLEYLDRSGPATVPTMARARRVSRQRIQTLVNGLADKRLVKAAPNPASRRSPLIEVTSQGRATIHGMRGREAAMLNVPIKASTLRDAAKTLAALRLALEDQEH